MTARPNRYVGRWRTYLPPSSSAISLATASTRSKYSAERARFQSSCRRPSRDHAGIDLPADITTLFIQVYDGHVPGHDFDKPNPAVPEWPPNAKAKGIIHIGLRDGVRSALSFRAPNATRAEKAQAIAKFLKFYAAGVYELYVRQSRIKLALIAGAILLAIAGVLVLALR